jgi:5-methyltetrahydropteroyltriglutamate--homocysteine methyltransferase
MCCGTWGYLTVARGNLKLTPEEVQDRILEPADLISVKALGTTDDRGFFPVADDISTSREIAFAKIRARVEGTRMAVEVRGVGFP